jgi:hypothetical protein
MGITNFSLELLQPVIDLIPVEQRSVFELGSQQTYVAGENYGRFSNWFYNENHFSAVVQVDLNGENGSFKLNLADLSQFNQYAGLFALVTDFGTSEHVSGPDGSHDPLAFLHCWLVKLLACAPGGYIVSENPLTGHWPGHGCNYVCEYFYLQLASLCGLDVVNLGVHYAMGNVTDGANVFCVLRKTDRFIMPLAYEFFGLPFYSK